MKRIVLHVDRVRLLGVDPAERERVVAELRETLQQQLAEPGAAERLAAIGHLESLRAVAGPPAPSAQPPSLGHSAGQAIVRLLTPLRRTGQGQ